MNIIIESWDRPEPVLTRGLRVDYIGNNWPPGLFLLERSKWRGVTAIVVAGSVV